MISGEQFISLAGKLASGAKPDEALCRTAISRAYYGAFHLASQMLTSLNVPYERNHGELHRCLAECGHAEVAESGRILIELHRLRVKADYKLDDAIVSDPQVARDSVEMAADIRSALAALDANGKNNVKAGIEAYHRKIGFGRPSST